jgi:putative glutathione S-transferase
MNQTNIQTQDSIQNNNTNNQYSYLFKNEVDSNGNWIRTETQFKNWINNNENNEFKPELDRYHLYVSLACPWAHRTLIMRKLKGLENIISVNIVDIFLDRTIGWTLEKKDPDSTEDTVNGFKTLKEVYLLSNPNYQGTITVPVLFDKKLKKIVNNESSEIIRMLNSEFNELATKNKNKNFYPENLKSEIDEINSWIYEHINNGVYKCGFSRSQEAYDVAVKNLFEHLDKVETILSTKKYLCGDELTEADIRLFTTLIRFDIVYYTHFKCNKKHIYEYPNLWNYLLELYQIPEFKETVNFYHIKNHYYLSHKHINPFSIVPIGPEINFNQPYKKRKLKRKRK